EADDKNKKELALQFELDTGHGFWIAARAEGTDGSLAHTTPIYVIRPPLRFWKFEALDDLIAARLANLDDVENLIARAKREQHKSVAHERLGLRLMIRQATQLQKRIDDARKFFKEMKQTAHRERSIRNAGK
ncbi:MAG: hypothetical protein ACYTA5_21365, partial [Planctomycetota bacterium]